MRKILLGTSALAFCAAFNQQALAAQTATDTGTIETVIVTAERHTTDVQKTAISITAVTAEQLSRENDVALASVLQNIPAVNIERSPQGGQLYIRGAGANGDANFNDPAVAVSLDDVYSGRAEAVFNSLYDVNRVEVLRGPQGLLYGRNADGGAINIITNAPSLDGFHASINGGAGNYSLMHFDGAVNLPLGDKFALRVAAMRDTHDGYLSNGGEANDLLAYRAKLLFQASDNFSIVGTVDYSHKIGSGLSTVPGINVSGAGAATSPPGPLPPPFDWCNSAGWYGSCPSNHWYTGTTHTADTDNLIFMTSSLKADWDMGWATLTVIPAYTHSRRYENSLLFVPTTINPPPFFAPVPFNARSAQNWTEDQYTGEVRLASPAGSRSTWVVGLYGLDSKDVNLSAAASNSTCGCFEGLPGAGNKSTSYAAFGEITYPLTDVLRLTGGLRYTQDNKSTSYEVISVNPATGLPYASSSSAYYDSGKVSAKQAGSHFNYKAGIEYDVAPQSLLYAQISTGYKAGGFGTVSIPPLAYKPETLTDYEIGSKNRFLDNKLQINLSAYYYAYSNLQVEYHPFGAPPLPPAAIPPYASSSAVGSPNCSLASYPVCENYIVTTNAGSGTNMGFELETIYRFLPTDELDLSLAYADATYGHLVITEDGDPPGSSAWPFCVAGSGCSLNLTGTPIVQTPKWSGTIAYEHDFDFSNGGRLVLRADTKLSSGYWAAVQHQFYGAWQGGFHRSNVYASYVLPNGNWSVNVWAKNLENLAQKTSVMPFWRSTISDPRTYGVSVSVKID